MDTSKFHTTTKNGNSFIITAFDYSSLQSFAGCLTDIGKTLFQNGDQWIDRRTLYEAVKCFSAYAGFAPRKIQEYIRCNRYGTVTKNGLKKAQVPRDFANGQLKAGCTFCIKLKSSIRIKKMPANPTPRSKAKHRDDFSDGNSVTIVTAVCEHGGQCKPSPQQQIMVRSRSGLYIKNVSETAFFTLCNMLKHNGKLKTHTIKNILQPIWPKNKNISKHDIFNVRLRIRRLLPKIEKCDTFESFQKSINTSLLLAGLDDENMSDDEAYEMATSVWKDLFNNGGNESPDSLLCFEEYLQILSEKAKGFVYDIAYDSDGTINGAVWQTATMRDNFERFGGFICLDVMKRGINKLLWPYLAVAMYNDLEQVCVGCEAIVCAERKEAYDFVVKFMCRNSPGRPTEDVYVVAGDGFFNQKMIESFGLPNAHFVADYYHLFDTVLPDRFGQTIYDKLEPFLKQMADARSETYFETALKSATHVLKSMTARDGRAENVLLNYAQDRDTYACYRLEQLKGTRGRRGSAPSEQNHSSVLVHLNDGEKKENKYCEQPHTLIKDLFIRQRTHVNKWNKDLFAEDLKMSVEVSRLEQLPSSKMTSDLIAAAKVLNKHAYDMFVKSYIRAREKLQMTNEFDDESKMQIICVRCIDYPNSKPRVFNTSFDRCNCGTSVAFEAQCDHEIKVRDGFDVSYFQKRHMRRNQVKGSLNGWSLKKDTTISGEIFNVQEDIDQSTCQGKNNIHNTDNLGAEDSVVQEISVNDPHVSTVHDEGNDDVEDNDYPMEDNCDEHIDEVDDQHIDAIDDQQEATVHVGAAMKPLTLSNHRRPSMQVPKVT